VKVLLSSVEQGAHQGDQTRHRQRTQDGPGSPVNALPLQTFPHLFVLNMPKPLLLEEALKPVPASTFIFLSTPYINRFFLV
jgi:hypothetical protein